MASTNVGSIHIDFNLDIENIKQSFSEISSNIRDLERKFGGFATTISKTFSKKRFSSIFSAFTRFEDVVRPIPIELDKVQQGIADTTGELPIFATAINKTSKIHTTLFRNVQNIARAFGEVSQVMPRVSLLLSKLPFGLTSDKANSLSDRISDLANNTNSFASCFGLAMQSVVQDASEAEGNLVRIFNTKEKSWNNFLSNLQSGWASTWQGITSALSKSLNAAVGQINSLIADLNRIQVNIPPIAPGKPGINFGFSIPKMSPIPMLATGGVVTAPTLAMIGERGREAVLPLQNNTGWMSELANIISNSVGSSSAPSKINLYMDSRKVAEGIIDDLKAVSSRRDISLGVI